MYEQFFETAKPANHRLKLNGVVVGFWGRGPFSQNDADWTAEQYVPPAAVVLPPSVSSPTLYAAYIQMGRSPAVASQLSGYTP